MDNFAQNAFAQAKELADKREAQAYADFMVKDSRRSELASLMDCGMRDAALLIATVAQAGLLETLRKYADNMLMAGFNGGYEAGYNNGLEDAK